MEVFWMLLAPCAAFVIIVWICRDAHLFECGHLPPNRPEWIYKYTPVKQTTEAPKEAPHDKA